MRKRFVVAVAVLAGAFAAVPAAPADPPPDNQLAKYCASLTKEELNLHPECNAVKHIV